MPCPLHATEALFCSFPLGLATGTDLFREISGVRTQRSYFSVFVIAVAKESCATAKSLSVCFGLRRKALYCGF
jgi:hypothetical protein